MYIHSFYYTHVCIEDTHLMSSENVLLVSRSLCAQHSWQAMLTCKPLNGELHTYIATCYTYYQVFLAQEY